MRHRIFAALAGLLAASGAAAQVADRAGNRMEPLDVVRAVSAEEAGTRSALHCTAARDLCLEARREGEEGPWLLWVHDALPADTAAEPTRRIPLPESGETYGDEVAIWPHLVRDAAGATIVGAEHLQRTGFSGGGAGETSLRLFALPDPGPGAATEPRVLLALPYGYSAMIRACFSEEDMAQRSGACHDELEFGASLLLDPATETGPPAFLYAAHARTFPRGALAEEDRRTHAPADLVWESDPACSYRRRFAADGDGGYAPDTPLPECDRYRIP
mgnify:FL=1